MDEFNENSVFTKSSYGSAFPTLVITQNEAINSNLNDRIHPLAYSPLTKNGQDISEMFFMKAKSYPFKNLEFVVDPTSPVKPESMIVTSNDFYWDTNKDGTYGNKDDMYAYTVKIYITRDGIQLEEAYLAATPKDREILLFLEDNSGDMSGACKWSKVGKYIKDRPKFFETHVLKNKNLADVVNKKIEISLGELQELLQNGTVKSKTLEVIDALYKVTQYLSSFNAKALHGIADAIFWGVEKIESNCKFEEYHWNPAAQKKDSDGKTEDSYRFEPVLFPFPNEVPDDVVAILKQGIITFEKIYTQYDQIILQSFKKDWGKIGTYDVWVTEFEIDVVPDSLQKLLQQKYSDVRTIIFRVLKQIKDMLPQLQEIIANGLNVVNAFLCGVWNGFVDAACGIISLIGYIFEGLALAQDVQNNFAVEFPRMLEKIDNFTEAWDKISFSAIFDEALKGIKNVLFEGSVIKAEEIAYFSGMFIGFIVELVVEIVGGILLTGGTVTVAATLEKLAAIPKGLASIAENLVKGVLNTGKAAAKGIAKGFEWLINFLREGTQKIIKLIKDFFENLRSSKTEILDNLPGIATQDLDWMASRRIGNLGGKVLKTAQIRKLRGILKKQGISLITANDSRKIINKLYKPIGEFTTFQDLLAHMNSFDPKLVGGFNAQTRQFVLNANATEIVVFHEMVHANQFNQLGEVAYSQLSKLDKEMHVWNQIISNRGRWTEAEIKDCLKYINQIRVREYNLNPLIIK